MIVKFEALGIDWEADVDYCPATPWWQRRGYEPPDEEDVQVVALWNAHTTNAIWLMDSQIGADLESAALEAAREAHRRCRGVFDEP